MGRLTSRSWPWLLALSGCVRYEELPPGTVRDINDSSAILELQEVKVPPQWTNIGETYLVSMHVNAVIKSRHSNFIVDVSGTRRNDWLETKKIPDNEAIAQYYNNLGADALVQQDLPKAYAWPMWPSRVRVSGCRCRTV